MKTHSAVLCLAVLVSALGAGCAVSEPVAAMGSKNDGGAPLDAPASDGALAHCALESHLAEPLPLSLYVMLDQSESMADAIPGGTKWQAITDALAWFVDQPETAGIRVGLGYFGVVGAAGVACNVDADCGLSAPCLFGKCSGALGGDSCDMADYQQAEVPMGILPASGPLIVQSLATHGPSSETPTLPALKGALAYARSWADSHPGHLVAVVLATDGEPSTCETDVAKVAQAAADAQQETPSISTFVIGVGSSLHALHQIAYAGQTGKVTAVPPCATESSACALLVDQDAGAKEKLVAAMNSIRSALGCNFALPKPELGTLDPEKVNVEITTSGASAPTIVGNTASASSCDPIDGGWYYDDPDNPTSIVLCPRTCADAQVPGSRIDIVLGCTIIPT